MLAHQAAFAVYFVVVAQGIMFAGFARLALRASSGWGGMAARQRRAAFGVRLGGLVSE